MTERQERIIVRICMVLALTFSGVAVYNANLFASTPESRAWSEIEEYQDSLILIGRKDARRTIVLATDHSCPYCRAMHDSLTHAMHRDSSAFNVRVLPLPLTSIHRAAERSARALYCASLEGDASRVDAQLYRLGEDASTLSDDSLAVAIGVAGPVDEFRACVNSGAASAFVARTASLAERAGATATPTMWLRARRFSGVVSVDSMLVSNR
jgi:protein-disulfide isomerase